jgi:hypothetical protein
MNNINSDPLLRDKPEWWKRIWAGVRDVEGVQMNAIANQAFLATAFTRQAVYDLCAMLDYQMSPQATSAGYLIFHMNPATIVFPAAFTEAELTAISKSSLTSASLQFEARSGFNIAALFSETFTANAGTDVLTTTGAHEYTTGEKVRVSSAGTIPPPLAVDTDYYAIYESAAGIRLAETIEKAYRNEYIDITGAGVGVHTIYLWSFQVECHQQRSISSSYVVGVSDGIAPWQTHRLNDKWVLPATLSIVIDGVAWTRVTTLVESGPADTHYRLIYLSDGDSMIMFGDGTYGAIPGNFGIYADYAVGGGANSNVYSQDKISNYTGGSADITGVTNSGEFTGGADEESMETARIIAPMLLKARNRCVTIEDAKYLAEQISGVLLAGVNANYYGLFSQQIIVVPNGGGLPAPALLTEVETTLEALTIMNSVYTVAVDPTYVNVSITMSIHKKSTAIWTTVQALAVLALRLLFSEVGKEILDVYASSGTSDAVDYINNKWATSFTAIDFSSIERILDNLESTDFNKTWYESDVSGFVDSFVDGVDYCIIAAPAFPITTGVLEISSDNINPALITEIP